jgi:hypothetical protein
MGNMSTTQFKSKGDTISFISQGYTCGYAYSEIHTIVQAPLADAVNVKLQKLAVLNISNVTEYFEVIGQHETGRDANRIANIIDDITIQLRVLRYSF